MGGHHLTLSQGEFKTLKSLGWEVHKLDGGPQVEGTGTYQATLLPLRETLSVPTPSKSKGKD